MLISKNYDDMFNLLG